MVPCCAEVCDALKRGPCRPETGAKRLLIAVQKLKALKRGAKREKREAAARDALKEAQAAMPTSPRQAANRMRGTTPTRVWQVCSTCLDSCGLALCSRAGALGYF